MDKVLRSEDVKLLLDSVYRKSPYFDVNSQVTWNTKLVTYIHIKYFYKFVFQVLTIKEIVRYAE